MTSVDNLLDLIDCTVRFKTPEGDFYEGIVKRVVPSAQTATIGRLILLPNRRMGSLNFRFWELMQLIVIKRPDCSKEKSSEEQNILPVYPKSAIEKLFDLDGGSDIDDEENLQVEYNIKLVPHLSKFVPKDFAIIDKYNQDFSLALNHIKNQNAIGISLEGVRISRSGTLTWLCISSTYCNFMFDILALGEQAFKEGLKYVLENPRIQKIIHDCRLASDCLYHKYGVRLVNVFDTQVADFVTMMQMTGQEKIDSRVNTLDACLSYYLEVPDDHLYGDANFDDIRDSVNFHALRPLKHEIQDVLIKNVMYLHLLKRELELAMLTPFRRATDVYINSVQKLEDKELLIMPHKPEELPPDMHLEGIQIFRYQQFEYLCETAASGPPYRELNNPIKNYLRYRPEYKTSQRKDKDSILNKHAHQSSDSSTESDQVQSVKLNHNSKIAIRTIDSTNGRSSDVKSKDSLMDEYGNSENRRLRILAKGLANLKKVPMTDKTPIHDQTSRSNSEETCTVKSAPAKKGSTDTIVHSNSACSLPCNNISKATSSQTDALHMPKKAPSEILALVSGRRPRNILTTASTSLEHSDEDSIASSKDRPKVKSVVQKAELVQSNSVLKKDTEMSDSEFKKLEARVKARGAILRNRQMECSASDKASMPDSRSEKAQDKLANESHTSSKSRNCLLEDVTIYCSQTLDKPSQFVVKVKQQSTRLIDLYEQAGDKSLLWAEENADYNSKPSSSQSDNYVDSDDIWAAIRKDLPSKPIDEKLRARFIPAGMAGY